MSDDAYHMHNKPDGKPIEFTQSGQPMEVETIGELRNLLDTFDPNMPILDEDFDPAKLVITPFKETGVRTNRIRMAHHKLPEEDA